MNKFEKLRVIFEGKFQQNLRLGSSQFTTPQPQLQPLTNYRVNDAIVYRQRSEIIVSPQK